MKQVTIPILTDEGATVFRTISEDGVVDRDADGNILDSRPLTPEEIEFNAQAEATAQALNEAAATAAVLRTQADTARQLMFDATEALIAWAANQSPTKYSLATLGPLKTQVQAAMFAYRDVPNDYKSEAGKVQYDYLSGRSVEVAFEIAAAALQSVAQLQTALVQKGLLS